MFKEGSGCINKIRGYCLTRSQKSENVNKHSEHSAKEHSPWRALVLCLLGINRESLKEKEVIEVTRGKSVLFYCHQVCVKLIN